MLVIYYPSFTQVYIQDPAAEPGRMEAILDALRGQVEFLEPTPATREQIALAHTPSHIEHVSSLGLYHIAALAAGGAIMTARTALREPSFGLIRPPGHHASSSSSWGFCYFNNMAIALLTLEREGLIRTALVLDIDLHFGDGTVNILGDRGWVKVINPSARDRRLYLEEISEALEGPGFDILGISAGFDYHEEDWGGLLTTEDYFAIGRMARQAALRWGAGCFGILEGGYNHAILGRNVKALLDGMQQ